MILELKNVLTDDKMIWQPIRYYDFLRRGEDELKKLLVRKIEFNINEVDFNPKIFIIIPDYEPQLLRSLSYFEENIDFKVIKFNLTLNYEIIKEEFKLSSIFGKEDLVVIGEKISKNWNFEEYINEGVDNWKVELAKQLVNYIKNKYQDVDIYFYDKRITVIVNKKILVYIYIKKKIYSSNLEINFRLSSKKPNNIELSLTENILTYKLKDNTLSISFLQLPIKFLDKYL